MPLKESLLAEYKNEAANTRKMLERVPTEKFAWKPHEKSMTIGRLASHIAEVPLWVKRIMLHDEFDFATASMKRETYADNEQLLQVFEEQLAEALSILQDASESDFVVMFTLRRGEHVFFTLPRKVVLRNFAFNHIMHHRGQLSVYLRLLDIPVPGMYGPSADER